MVGGLLEPSKKFKTLKFEGYDKKQYSIDVGYERFLGPEMFFHPVNYLIIVLF